MPPEHLTMSLPRLPAILHTANRLPVSDYSKGSWGLSVLLRESGIFTGITTSPSSSLRQCPYRYKIRAGRNLPDKEFRYLRTIGHLSHSMYPLARLRSAVFLLNSRMGPFTVPPRGGPLLPKLRGYCAEFLNEVSLARLGILVPSHLCRFWYG